MHGAAICKKSESSNDVLLAWQLMQGLTEKSKTYTSSSVLVLHALGNVSMYDWVCGNQLLDPVDCVCMTATIT